MFAQAKSFVGQRILTVQYTIPDHVQVSMECRHLLSRIFVPNPEEVTLKLLCWPIIFVTEINGLVKIDKII